MTDQTPQATTEPVGAVTDDDLKALREAIGIEYYAGSDRFGDAFKRIHQHLALAAPAEGWQGIETAPKDGTAILCLYADRYGSERYSIRYWASGDWPSSGRKEGWCDQHRQLRGADPTHWMPLPAAPTGGRS